MLDGSQSAYECKVTLASYQRHVRAHMQGSRQRYVLQEVLEQTNISTFQELLNFVATTHQPATTQHTFGQRRRIIPTALTFAGGVNSADHAQTFPALVDLLRQQVKHQACKHRQLSVRTPQMHNPEQSSKPYTCTSVQPCMSPYL